MQLKPSCWRCSPQWRSIAGCRWLTSHPSGSNCAVPPQPKERMSSLPASSLMSALPCHQTHVAASSWDEQRACNRKLCFSMVQYNYIMYLQIYQSAESNSRHGSHKAWMALVKKELQRISNTLVQDLHHQLHLYLAATPFINMCSHRLVGKTKLFVCRLCSSLMQLQEITSPSLFFMACFASVLCANFTTWATRAGCSNHWVSLLATSAVPIEYEVINNGKDTDSGK